MLDDLLESLLGEAFVRSGPNSKRAQWIARIFFGLLGTGLCLAGAWHILFQYQGPGHPATLASMIAVFGFLAAFFLFNVALARTWRWPGWGFVFALVAIFVARILLGT